MASHVWRLLAPESSDVELASRDPLTYSFIPNLVWLPSSVASLTDREGSFAQTYLKALSMKLYREAPVSGDMRPIVERAWAKLPSPTGIPADGLPDEDELNFFDDTTQFVKRRRRTVEVVVEALRLIEAGSPLPRKVVSRRYTEGLPSVAQPPVRELAAHLSSYLAASTDEVGTDI